jgi:hypothetical protein
VKVISFNRELLNVKEVEVRAGYVLADGVIVYAPATVKDDDGEDKAERSGEENGMEKIM